jgi:TldD protein
MTQSSPAFDAAAAAVEAALAAGARYADARVVSNRHESMAARNGDVEDLNQTETAGVGVRALVGSSWGFFGVPDLTDAVARDAGARAAAIAQASSSVPGPAADLVPVQPQVGSWANPIETDPFEVSLATKGDLLAGATSTSHRAGADLAEGLLQAWDTSTWFVSSEGARIDQRVRKCGGGIWSTVVGEGETQRRSYPSYFGQYGQRGWELITEFDLPAHAERLAEEARALLAAPACPATETDVVIGSEQLALQIHESVGHAIELDRILGWEAAYAGTSWLDLGGLGSLRYGSDLMTIRIDPTFPGALGSFGYDDACGPTAGPGCPWSA